MGRVVSIIMSYGYRRGGGGYRRSWSGGARKSNSFARRELRKELVTATGTLATGTMNVPIDSTRNLGIRVHELEVEQSVAFPVVAASIKYQSVGLNRNTPAAERHISDIDCIAKIKFGYYISSDVGHPFQSQIHSVKLYPPVPVFQDEIVLWAYQDSGGAMTYYTRTIYTVAWMSRDEIVGIAKNIII